MPARGFPTPAGAKNEDVEKGKPSVPRALRVSDDPLGLLYGRHLRPLVVPLGMLEGRILNNIFSDPALALGIVELGDREGVTMNLSNSGTMAPASATRATATPGVSLPSGC